METKAIAAILGVTLLALTGTVSASPVIGHVYYVATTGNDSNNGSQAAPWRHLAKATATGVAGDTVYVRIGTYNKQVIFTTSGTAGNPITFSAYPGELPVINYGNWLPSGPLDGVVQIKADYITFEGFEVRDGSKVTVPNYNGMGIKIFGNNDIILNNTVDIIPDTGIWTGGNNTMIQGNTVHHTNLLNINGANSTGGGWGSGIVVRGPRNGATFASGNVIRNNTVHDNWGEGIYCYYGVTNTTITGNTSYDNWSLNIGLSSSYNGVISDNLSYISHSPGAPEPGEAIVVTIDDDTIDPPPNNNAVYNNFVYGGEIDVQQFQTYTSAIPIRNTFVYFNTVVNPGGYAYMMGGSQKGLIIREIISSTEPEETHIIRMWPWRPIIFG